MSFRGCDDKSSEPLMGNAASTDYVVTAVKKLISDFYLICKQAVVAGQGLALKRYLQECNKLEQGRLVGINEFSVITENGFCVNEPPNARRDEKLVAVPG